MDYYAVLAIDPSATESDIRTAFKQMAVKYHPDKNMDEQSDAEIRFKLVLEAYEVLSNVEKRQKYDSKRHRRKMHGNAMSNDYDVAADDFGMTIHDMTIHRLAKLDDVFSQDVGRLFEETDVRFTS